MNIILLGAAGFIGTNLTLALAKDPQNCITLVDRDRTYFASVEALSLSNVSIAVSDFAADGMFDALLAGQDVVYHLVSTTIPTNSNQQIPQELTANVVFTANLLESCVRCGVKQVVFLSSGGTVYGKETDCPLREETVTYPISSYGLQKITIEKLLHLYHHIHGLDYRIIRLANPYGPYQRPNGQLGAVTTFTYRALRDEPICVYGDGSVVRDFIYIDDAIRGILNIVQGGGSYRTYNLGSGRGTSIRQVIDAIGCVLEKTPVVEYCPGRAVDVPVNYLDISRYEQDFGPLAPVCLEEGIARTVEFMQAHYL